MIFTSVKQLKDMVKNRENKLGLPSNTLLNYYMMEQLKKALFKKSEERNTLIYLKEKNKHLSDITKSKELQEIWGNYRKKNSYAKNVTWEAIIETLNNFIHSIDFESELTGVSYFTLDGYASEEQKFAYNKSNR